VPQQIYIDVSELEAPEPFEQIMPLVRSLQINQYIKVLHRKEPFPLYEILLENGYNYRAIPVNSGQYWIVIWISSDNKTAEFCQKMDFNQSITL